MSLGRAILIEEALTDVKSAIVFHIETFGREVLEEEFLEAYEK